jgi:hypothetical protein
MAANLDDKEEKKAFSRKQRQDPNPDRKGKAINVKTEETVVEKAGEKDACYKKVKSRYSVWPSAYASGALVKCRKVGASNWGNKSESVEYSDWRDDFKAIEYEFIDIIKAEPLVSEGAMPDAIDPKKHKVAQKKTKIRNMTQSPNKNEAEVARKMSKGPSLPMEEVDTRRAPAELVARMSARREGEMAQDGPNKSAYDAKQRILAKTKAKKVETVDEGQKCWKGYEKKGTKKMFGKTYNNCVKKEEKEESRVGGGNLKKLAIQATKRIDADVDGDVDSVDMKSPETGVFVPSPDGKKKLKPKVRFEGASDWKSELGEGAAWTKKSGKSKSGGLNEKGRKSYERENPGSDLKAPSKKVGNPRRKSFCARMKGMRKRQKPSNNTGDDRLSKSLRAWNC